MPVSIQRRSRFPILAALLGSSLAGAAAEVPRTASPRAPNILLIIADDVGLDVSTTMYPGLTERLARQYGPSGLKHPGYRSIVGHPASLPVLDRFARQGMVFSNVWAQPFCSPTRASILTGLTAGKARVLSYADPLSSRYTSFVQKLRDEAGYSTALFGKWHLAGLPAPNQGSGKGTSYPGMKPRQAGFDLFRGNLHAALKLYWDYDYQVQDADTPADQWRTEQPPVRSLPGIAPTNFAPVVKVADALDWIRTQEKANPAKPWFAWLAFNLSHATAQQQPSAMAVPNADTLDEVSRREMQACGGQFGSNNTGSCSGEALMRAMTNSLDTLVGKLLDEVDRLGQDTYVIYIGDNGTAMYGRPNLDFIDNMYITRKDRGKGTAYESGARVPMAIRGPGIAAGKHSTEFVHVADLFPTILSLAGRTPPATVSNGDGTGNLTVDGISLLPILKGKATHVRDPDRSVVLTESLNLMTNSTRQVGARDGTFKVICTEKTDPSACVFYNLKADPLEEYPLAKPDSCAVPFKMEEPAWHFCRLNEAVRTQSFLAQSFVAQSGP